MAAGARTRSSRTANNIFRRTSRRYGGDGEAGTNPIALSFGDGARAAALCGSTTASVTATAHCVKMRASSGGGARDNIDFLAVPRRRQRAWTATVHRSRPRRRREDACLARATSASDGRRCRCCQLIVSHGRRPSRQQDFYGEIDARSSECARTAAEIKKRKRTPEPRPS